MASELFNPTSSTKKRFGKLRFYATPVELKSGASYVIPGIPNFEKNGDKEWRGKAKVSQSGTRHVVMALTQTSREGQDYVVTKDYLNGDKFYKKNVFPFITSNNISLDTEYLACVEESESGEYYKEKAVMDWKPVAIYATPEAMKAASDEYFAQFANNSTAEAAALDIPEPYTAENWTPAFVTQFQAACDEVIGKPPPVAAQLKAKIAADWGVSPAYVESHVVNI